MLFRAFTVAFTPSGKGTYSAVLETSSHSIPLRHYRAMQQKRDGMPRGDFSGRWITTVVLSNPRFLRRILP